MHYLSSAQRWVVSSSYSTYSADSELIRSQLAASSLCSTDASLWSTGKGSSLTPRPDLHGGEACPLRLRLAGAVHDDARTLMGCKAVVSSPDVKFIEACPAAVRLSGAETEAKASVGLWHLSSWQSSKPVYRNQDLYLQYLFGSVQ